MEGLVRGDIAVVEFPYSDLKNSKRRPVLILKVPKGGDVIVLQITGYSYEKLAEIALKNTDFNKGSLKRDSFVRVDKIASIERSLIKYVAGSLKGDKFEEILERVCIFLKAK